MKHKTESASPCDLKRQRFRDRLNRRAKPTSPTFTLELCTNLAHSPAPPVSLGIGSKGRGVPQFTASGSKLLSKILPWTLTKGPYIGDYRKLSAFVFRHFQSLI